MFKYLYGFMTTLIEVGNRGSVMCGRYVPTPLIYIFDSIVFQERKTENFHKFKIFSKTIVVWIKKLL